MVTWPFKPDGSNLVCGVNGLILVQVLTLVVEQLLQTILILIKIKIIPINFLGS